MQFAVNIGFIYADLPFAQRVQAVRHAGFPAVESFWPGAAHLDEFARAVGDHDMAVALINVDEGDYRMGDRGFASHPDRRQWWRSRLTDALALAERVECSNLNVLTGYFDARFTEADQHACLVENLAWGASLASGSGVSLLLEPLNEKTHDGYICTSTKDAIAAIDDVGADNVGIQFDFYQIGGSEGAERVLDLLNDSRDHVRHIQVADVPDRGAPGTGTLHYTEIFAALEDIYSGYVGLEYQPDPSDPFGWMSAYDI